jgi:S-adenosylmethionine decarboxylase
MIGSIPISKVKSRKEALGWHYIVEIKTKEPQLLDDPDRVCAAIEKATKEGNLTVVGKITKRFEPQGFTAVYLLSESHISIHTWPEIGYAAIDVYTCGGDAKKAVETLLRELNVESAEITYLDRGPVDEG